jgi:pyruvate carboxylase subunit B
MIVVLEGENLDGSHDAIARLGDVFVVTIDGKSVEIYPLPDGSLTDGNSLILEASVVTEREQLVRERFLQSGATNGAAASRSVMLKAPMPGLIRRLNVREGDIIEKNDQLVVLEAMKMENNLLAPGRHRVTKVFVEENASVEKNAPLLELGAAD